ncbi:hypothetical protein AQJ23_16625 [Streptomyces antibioticus]|nr:hypothetical protein [Streptomyces antibioticus]KUN25497.1 hypothetical protein AQJ23_16625 [Streptomyces antibioticus]
MVVGVFALVDIGVDHLRRSRDTAAQTAVLAEGRPAGYPVSLAAKVRLTTSRLAAEQPGALALLSALALLAPEPFPVTVCGGCMPGEASAPLAQALASRLAAGPVLRAIGRHSLARVQDGSVQLHRLTQTVLADQLTPDQHRQAAQDAETLLAAAHPGDVAQPASWPGWRQLLPHLLAVDPASITTEEGRNVARDACWYLMDRGQARPAREFLEEVYDTWSRQLGPPGPRRHPADRHLPRPRLLRHPGSRAGTRPGRGRPRAVPSTPG